MRVVQVDHVRPEPADEPPQGEGGGGHEVASERDLLHVEIGGARAVAQRGRGAAGHDDLVAPALHAFGREEHLVLPAAPAAGGVDVQDPHVLGGPAPSSRSRSLASFTYV